jgi:predicted DNA-binding protein (MmcQ/YjbR family)
MTLDTFRDYCLNKPGVTEGTPFGPTVLVLKVGGKMFALCDLESFASVNLKCNPERAIELRERHQSIVPGYHMNKQHWNTVYMDGGVPEDLLRQMIDDSWQLIYDSLPAKIKATITG